LASVPKSKSDNVDTEEGGRPWTTGVGATDAGDELRGDGDELRVVAGVVEDDTDGDGERLLTRRRVAAAPRLRSWY